MKLNRTKNATRNIIFGIILKIYQLIMPFILRTVMIFVLGVEYLGLNSLFVSILQVLNLAELGVGSAMVFSMYKPIVDEDHDMIRALLNLYKKYYRIIGLIILGIGLLLIPFLPYLISGNIPSDIDLLTLYLLNLTSTVSSYLLFAYRGSILEAHQRVDISSKIILFTDTFKYILQIISLIIFHNYYFYVIVNIISQILANVLTAYMAKCKYPNYKPQGHLPKQQVQQINRKIKDLFTSRLGGVIVNSSDTLIISSFLGLFILAQYQNYFFVISSVIALLSIVFTSCMAGIGNSILTESTEKNFIDLKKFTMIIAYLSGFCTVCFVSLLQPFIELWLGRELLANFSIVICLCIYYFIYEINQLLNLYKDAAGLWHEDRFRPLVTALLNLILNLLTVRWLGLYGVILSTVVSMLFVGIPWILHNLFTVLFEQNRLSEYLRLLGFVVVITFIACIVNYFICSFVVINNKFISLIIKGIISCFISNAIFIFSYHKLDVFKESFKMLDNITNGLLSKIVNIFLKK